MEIPDLQLYSWNLNLIKNVEDFVVLLTSKVFIYTSFSKAAQVALSEKPQMKKGKKQKHWYLIHI